MLIETLQSVLQAGLRTVNVTCGINAEVDRLAAIDESDFSFCFSTVFLQRSTPVDTIVMSCEAELAARVADTLLPPASNEGPDSEQKRTEAGFQILSNVFQRLLTREAGWYQPAAEQLDFVPGALRARCTGDRTYHVRIPTGAGSLHLLVNLARTHGERQAGVIETPAPPQGEPAGGPGHESIPDEEVASIVRRIVDEEMGLQLEIPGDALEVHVQGATVVGSTTIQDVPVLTLATPGLTTAEQRASAGCPVWAYFLLDHRMVSFATYVMGTVDRDLGSSALRLLALRVPQEMVRAERRRAFRLQPEDEIPVEIEPWLPDPGAGRPGSPAPISIARHHVAVPSVIGTVRDLSTRGARLGSNDRALVDVFTEGALVLTQFELPRRWGYVSLPGIVRHTSSISNGHGVPYHQLGLEFLSVPAWASFESALERVRQYVMGEQHRKLSQLARPVLR